MLCSLSARFKTETFNQEERGKMSECESLTTKTVKPINFKADDFRKKNPLNDVNTSIVAGNLINTCQRVERWFFTWEDYVNNRIDGTLDLEHAILDKLVIKDLLRYKNGVYRVQDSFIQFCAELICCAA
jgi:hypothetical protein